MILAIIPKLLDALIALPQIGTMVGNVINAILLWWINRQNQQTLADIADAAAMSARASTDDERYAAAALWQSALKRARVSP